MGSAQEAKQLAEFSKSDEGKTIEEIGKSKFEQNIYVCGDYDMKFFENYMTDLFINPKYDFVNYYYKMAKHKLIKEWHFFFSPKTYDFKEIEKNTRQFIDDHNRKPEDFDDFKEKSKTRIMKTTILYFNDKNKNNFANFFLKYNPNFIPFVIFIGTKEDNDEIKDYINKSIIDLKKEIDSNLFKYSDFNENIENNLFNLNINLIECAAFYNELGDEFKFPKKLMDNKLMENDLNDLLNNFSTFNILICGRPGSGKSTFINGMIKTMICKSGKGGECSKRIVKYIHRKLPITFYDTPGISDSDKINAIINLIRNINVELGEAKSKIHAVFYVLNGLDSRSFYDYEKIMFEVILGEYKLPVYFLITRVTDLQSAEDDKPIIKKNFHQVIKNIANISSNYTGDNVDKFFFYVNVIGQNKMGVDKLFSKVYSDFRQYIIYQKITKNNIKEVTKNSIIGQLNNPKDIAIHPVKLCEHVNLTYRIIARSIYSSDKGSTFLSAAFLRTITNIFGVKTLSLDECKRIIKSMDFQVDEKNKKSKKKFKNWFWATWYYDYKTPAEEEISYLADKYINLYKNDLENDEEKCLEYLDKVRITLNEAIEGLNKISLEYKNIND